MGAFHWRTGSIGISMKKLRIQGERSGDKEWWTEDAREHCGRCYDDVGETSVVHQKRAMAQREEGAKEERADGRRREVTVDLVLRTWRRLQQDTAAGLGDCLKAFPKETLFERTHQFDKRYGGEGRALESWKIFKAGVFLKKKTDGKPGKRRFRGVALMSMMAKWYGSVVMELDGETEEWKEQQVGGAERERWKALPRTWMAKAFKRSRRKKHQRKWKRTKGVDRPEM